MAALDEMEGGLKSLVSALKTWKEIKSSAKDFHTDTPLKETLICFLPGNIPEVKSCNCAESDTNFSCLAEKK